MAAKRSRAPLSRACKKRKLVARPGSQLVAHAVAAVQNQLPPPLNQQLTPALSPGHRIKQNFRLPVELMLKIMSELDIFTAKCWSLTCVQFNEECKDNFGTFTDAMSILQFPEYPDVAFMLVLPLSTSCIRYDGTYTNLMRCVYPIMPAHLWWNSSTGRFDSAATHRETTDRYMGIIQREADEREQRHHERCQEKSQRQLDRADRNEVLHSFQRAKIESRRIDGEDYSDFEFSVSDDGAHLYSDSESGWGTDSEVDDSDDEVATDDEEENWFNHPDHGPARRAKIKIVYLLCNTAPASFMAEQEAACRRAWDRYVHPVAVETPVPHLGRAVERMEAESLQIQNDNPGLVDSLPGHTGRLTQFPRSSRGSRRVVIPS
ncbi:hypothetical protein IFR05_015216 [Cadophora sp. M221]|nr:hypothetical protein IFR05_015216 [Cadophora sp. M221]